MARRTSGSAAATPALAVVEAAGVWHQVHRFRHDPSAESYGHEAAAALAVEPERVLKTLCVVVDGELCVAVVPVCDRLDLKRAAAALGGGRADLADPTQAERATGYVVGGISPLGQRRSLRTVLEETVLEETVLERGTTAWSTIFVSAGRRGLELELAPADLVRLTRATTAPISRPADRR